MRRELILKSFISVGSKEEFIEDLFSLVDRKVSSYVCFANVHMLIEAYQDESFQKIVNHADLVAPDGRPLSIFLQWFKGINQERICGMDMLPEILQWAEALNKSVYFYGTTPELLETIAQKAKNEFPKLRIAGYYSPPFKNMLTDEESSGIANMIKASAPDFVFAALGCPKQEKWIAAMKHEINACFLGLGQAFQVYAGKETRLPDWMRSLSLEWVYRLYQEPKRLWKRYAYTNSYFLLLIGKYTLQRFFQFIFASIYSKKIL